MPTRGQGKCCSDDCIAVDAVMAMECSSCGHYLCEKHNIQADDAALGGAVCTLCNHFFCKFCDEMDCGCRVCTLRICANCSSSSEVVSCQQCSLPVCANGCACGGDAGPCLVDCAAAGCCCTQVCRNCAKACSFCDDGLFCGQSLARCAGAGCPNRLCPKDQDKFAYRCSAPADDCGRRYCVACAVDKGGCTVCSNGSLLLAAGAGMVMPADIVKRAKAQQAAGRLPAKAATILEAALQVAAIRPASAPTPRPEAPRQQAPPQPQEQPDQTTEPVAVAAPASTPASAAEDSGNMFSGGSEAVVTTQAAPAPAVPRPAAGTGGSAAALVSWWCRACNMGFSAARVPPGATANVSCPRCTGTNVFCGQPEPSNSLGWRHDAAGSITMAPPATRAAVTNGHGALPATGAVPQFAAATTATTNAAAAEREAAAAAVAAVTKSKKKNNKNKDNQAENQMTAMVAAPPHNMLEKLLKVYAASVILNGTPTRLREIKAKFRGWVDEATINAKYDGNCSKTVQDLAFICNIKFSAAEKRAAEIATAEEREKAARAAAEAQAAMARLASEAKAKAAAEARAVTQAKVAAEAAASFQRRWKAAAAAAQPAALPAAAARAAREHYKTIDNDGSFDRGGNDRKDGSVGSSGRRKDAGEGERAGYQNRAATARAGGFGGGGGGDSAGASAAAAAAAEPTAFERRMENAIASNDIKMLERAMESIKGKTGYSSERKLLRSHIKRIHAEIDEAKRGRAAAGGGGGGGSGGITAAGGGSQWNYQHGRAGGGAYGYLPLARPGLKDCHIRVPVAPNIVGWVIGVAGGRIKGYMKRTGASVRILPGAEYADEPQYLCVEGEPNAVHSAFDLLLADLEHAPAPAPGLLRSNSSGGGGHPVLGEELAPPATAAAAAGANRTRDSGPPMGVEGGWDANSTGAEGGGSGGGGGGAAAAAMGAHDFLCPRLEAFLRELNLLQYFDRFGEVGWDFDSVVNAEESDFVSIKLLRGHMVKLRNAIAQHKQHKLQRQDETAKEVAPPVATAVADPFAAPAVPVAVAGRVPMAAAVAVPTPRTVAAAGGGAGVDDGDRDCVVCQDEEKNALFLSCGHLCVCEDCADLIEQSGKRQCPLCRKPYTKIIRGISRRHH